MLFVMQMNMSPVAQWQSLDLFMLFVMWSIMMAGMMLPSATPVFLFINKINEQRRRDNRTYSSSLFFVVGYLLTWVFYSFIITLVQWGLHHLTLLSPMMKSNNSLFTALLLISAGLYQFTSLKQACLSLCQSPLGFITSQWREGAVGTIIMGFKHGVTCLGCCWVLMSLLFVIGVMNIKWILVLTLLVLIEKVFAKGELFSRCLGGGLIISGGLILII